MNNNRKSVLENRNSKPSRSKKELKTLRLHQLTIGTRNKYDKLVPPISITGLTPMLEINKGKNLINRFTLLLSEVLCIRIEVAF